MDTKLEELLNEKMFITQLQNDSESVILHLTDLYMKDKTNLDQSEYLDLYLTVYLKFAAYAKIKLNSMEHDTTKRIESIQDVRKRKF